MAEAVTSGWRTHTSSCRRVSPGRVRHTVLAFNTGSDGSFRPRISLEQELGGKRTPLSSGQAMCQPFGFPFREGQKSVGDTYGEGRYSSIYTVPVAYREGWKNPVLIQAEKTSSTRAAIASNNISTVQTPWQPLPSSSQICPFCPWSSASPRLALSLHAPPGISHTGHALQTLSTQCPNSPSTESVGFPVEELRDPGAGGPFQVCLHPCCWLIPSLHPSNTAGPYKGGKGSDQLFLFSSAVKYGAKQCANYPQTPSNNPKPTVTS